MTDCPPAKIVACDSKSYIDYDSNPFPIWMKAPNDLKVIRHIGVGEMRHPNSKHLTLHICQMSKPDNCREISPNI